MGVVTKSDLEELKKLRRTLTMETAVFEAGYGERVKILSGYGGSTPKMTTTEFIVDRTRRWRETWVLPVLDGLIEKYDGKKGG